MGNISKRWCFTVNNWSAEHLSQVQSLSSVSVYLVWGEEVGDSGTPHLQGFVYLVKNYRLSALKKLLPTAHWEVAKGTNQQASDYCKKDGEFTEIGTCPLPRGKSEMNRWEQAVQCAKEGRIDDVPADIQLRYLRTLKEIKKDHMTPPPNLVGEVKMLWYYGDSGTGKSRKAREDHPDAYLKMCNKWWDGYDEHDVVLIEDFDKAHSVLGHHLKIWSDRYSFLAETKGGAIAIRPTLIIVTSNWHPSDIWFDSETIDPIMRRFKCVKFSKLQ